MSIEDIMDDIYVSLKGQKGEYSLNLEIKDADDVLINKLDST